MTLRSQIHSAIDDVAPPAPALSHDAVAYVLSNGRRRTERPTKRQPRWAIGMRQAGTLVAAVLVIVMMVTLVVGGRLWRDWNAQQQNAARQAHIAHLRERPLYLPIVNPGAACPESPYDLSNGYPGGYGSGPIYAEGSGARFVTESGTYFDTTFGLGYFDLHPETAFPVSGPVLIRARDLATNQTVMFGVPPFANFLNQHQYPANPDEVSKVSGTEVLTDTVVGVPIHFYTELVLEQAHPWWETMEGLPKGASGCIGIQADGFNADGTAFSEVIVVNYLLLS